MIESGFIAVAQIAYLHDGTRTIAIKDLYEQSKDNRWKGKVNSCDLERLKIVQANAVEVVLNYKPQRVFKVILGDGSNVTCLATQRFLTTKGFKPLFEITENDSIGLFNWSKYRSSRIREIKDEGFASTYMLRMTEGKSYIVNGIVVES